MARVILEVPNEKMQSFLQAILHLGLDRHAISSSSSRKSPFTQRRRKDITRYPVSRYLLFDWEFFSNELEYE